MIKRLFLKFSLRHEREPELTIFENIEKGVEFRGTNLWILIFAIFVASLGLNVNSTAVIIGAMLISPLMGPIMGLGLSVGINDLALLRKSLYNYLVATSAALTTSTVFFLLSPLNEAHSEILARTAPNIYDVLIALFGGFAGIIATSSRQKGNVIPGVAIATALMPPLCTAGYGLATLRFNYFFGAFYLFIINTVFIALATFITSRVLRFPYKHLPDGRADRRSMRIIWAVVLLTLIPSIYFGYDLVQQDRFRTKANHFIDAEGSFKNDYLLNKTIDAKKKVISLVYGGDVIGEEAIKKLRSKLTVFDLADAKLEIHQGFAYLAVVNKVPDNHDQTDQLNSIIKAKEYELAAIKRKMDSLHALNITGTQVYEELRTQYPDLREAVISPGHLMTNDSVVKPVLLVALDFRSRKSHREKEKIKNWLAVRFRRNDLKILF